MTRPRFILAAILLTAGLALFSTACGSGNTSPALKPAPVEMNAVEAAPIVPKAAAPAPIAPVAKDPAAKKVVVLDPGHGGDEVGAANNGVVEKASNLEMALRVEKLLLADGFDVVLTRRTDTRVADGGPGYTATRNDLQGRIDAANAAQGDVFVSIHSNGSDDAGQNGVEAWYDSKRDYATENLALARSILTNVLGELHNYGYDATNRGLYDGSCFRLRMGRCFTLFVIGGPRETTRQEVINRGGDPEALGFNGQSVIYSRATAMPAALIELLIITNRTDNAVLRDDAGRQALARGVANGIAAFLSAP